MDREQLTKRIEAQKEFVSRQKESQLYKERYGFTIVRIDDNSVHIRDKKGREVLFEYPYYSGSKNGERKENDDYDMGEYDRFILQMSNRKDALPPIETISLVISKPLIESDEKPAKEAANHEAEQLLLPALARKHGMSTDEMLAMNFVAREELYARFKVRLRDGQISR